SEYAKEGPDIGTLRYIILGGIKGSSSAGWNPPGTEKPGAKRLCALSAPQRCQSKAPAKPRKAKRAKLAPALEAEKEPLHAN
ncbi:MAG: hypothetical protein K2X44_12175, partial [Magnetospirillum sp.]|nr:hypothetical protein [Magnetospirillum sp.]